MKGNGTACGRARVGETATHGQDGHATGGRTATKRPIRHGPILRPLLPGFGGQVTQDANDVGHGKTCHRQPEGRVALLSPLNFQLLCPPTGGPE